MVVPKPENDGITHLNIYSKGKTELGKFLSNFAYCPIETEDGYFQSIESYWYWLSCKDDRLRKTSGYEAKHLGRQLGGKDWCSDDEFKRKICAAITIKLNTVEAQQLLRQDPELLELPFVHYYTYGTKVVEPKQGKWIIEHIKSVISSMDLSKNICQNCGSTENLSTGPDPYVEEIGQKIVIVTLCDKCYHESCMDI